MESTDQLNNSAILTRSINYWDEQIQNIYIYLWDDEMIKII